MGSPPRATFRMTPSRGTYILLSVFCGLLEAFFGWVAIRKPGSGVHVPLILIAVIYISLVVALRWYDVSVEGDELVIRSCLRRDTRIPISKIESIKLEANLADRVRPPFLLVVKFESQGEQRQCAVNAKLFSLDDLRRLSALAEEWQAARNSPE